MRYLTFIFLVFLFSSCHSNSSNSNNLNTTADADSVSITADTSFTSLAAPDSSYEVVSAMGYYVWEVNAEKKTLKKNPAVTTMDANLDSVINGLNRQYEDIRLEKTGISKDTLKLRIRNSEYLSNQMGSSGPQQYFAQAVINLTSVPGIKYVSFDFEEGQHASPGTWSRKDFPGYIIIQ